MMARRPVGGKAAVALAREAALREAARAAAPLSCTESCRDASARQGYSRVLVPRVRPTGGGSASSSRPGRNCVQDGRPPCAGETDGFLNGVIHVKPGQQAGDGKDPAHGALRSWCRSKACAGRMRSVFGRSGCCAFELSGLWLRTEAVDSPVTAIADSSVLAEPDLGSMFDPVADLIRCRPDPAN
jgi:hypothetical protein